MSNGVSLNMEQGLYVIACGGGYSCFGFENCWRDVVAFSQKLGHPVPSEGIKGTLECYALYRRLISEYGRSPMSKSTWFTPGTDPKVSQILDRYRGKDSLLRLFFGDPATGWDSAQENDVVGEIGRSMGVTKVPLISEPGDCGGMAISTERIVRIIDVHSQKELYRCANYVLPDLSIAANVDPDLPAYSWVGYRGNELQARFRTLYEAAEWLEFLLGRKPAKDEHLRAAARGYRRAA